MLQVVEVVTELPGGAFIRTRVAAAHLGPARDAGLHQAAALIVWEAALELSDERRLLRPWTDQRHVATEHVPELRELVDVQLAHQPADGENAIVVAAGPLRASACASGRMERSLTISNSRPPSPTRRWR